MATDFNAPEAMSLVDRLRDGYISIDDFNEQRRKQDYFDFQGCTFRNTPLSQINLIGCNLAGAEFVECNLVGARFDQAGLSEARFHKCQMDNACFFEAGCNRTEFYQCALRGANFEAANLARASLSGCDLRGAAFLRARLPSADLSGAVVNVQTNFSEVTHLSECKIDRYSLACLGKNLGGLTEGNRMDMVIRDDVALLRSQFGGVWLWMHLAAVALFLAPYAWFLAQIYVAAKFHPDAEPSVSVGVALLRYIVFGGQTWRTWQVHWSVLTFTLFLVYNVFRMLLLWKTKQLETQQTVTGLPAKFSLDASSRWLFIYGFTRLGYWVAVVLAIWHSLYFLTMRVPL